MSSPIKLMLILSVLMSLAGNIAKAATYQGRGSRPETSYVVYIPDKLDRKKKQPWIMGFDPGGNGMQVLNVMQQACDENGWIAVASNNSHNGFDFKDLEPLVLDTISSAERSFPLDPSRMYAGGLSGGSQVAHWLTAKHPELVRGVVINCGKIHDELKTELGYPSGKDAFFMTNPQDFRYKEIRADYQFLISHGCRAQWSEFPGGHEWAPPAYFSAAFKWMNQQARLHPPPVVAVKPPPPSLSALQDQLSALQKSGTASQDKISSLQEQIADAQVQNGKLADAEATYKAVLSDREKAAPDTPTIAALLKKLGDMYASQGNFSAAADALQRAMNIQEKGTDKTVLAQTTQAYAKVLYKSGKTAEADALYAKLRDMQKK